MKPNIGISDKNLENINSLLSTVLADEMTLYIERIGKLGGKTIGTMKEFSAAATLKESPGKYPSHKHMLQELLDDNESLIKQLRKQVDACSEKYSDAGTADFLTGIMEEHETTAWVLRRYLN